MQSVACSRLSELAYGYVVGALQQFTKRFVPVQFALQHFYFNSECISFDLNDRIQDGAFDTIERAQASDTLDPYGADLHASTVFHVLDE